MEMQPFDFTGCAKLLEWDSLRGLFTLHEAIAMQTIIKTLPENAIVVELGTFQGKSSVAMAAVLPKGGKLYCVDHFMSAIVDPGEFTPSDRKQVLKANLAALAENLKHYGVIDRVEIIVSKTSVAGGRFDDASVDLVLVDADHSYEGVMQDLTAWLPKIKLGGYLVCDDYCEEWEGVIRATRELGLPGRLIAPTLWLHQKQSPLLGTIPFQNA